MAGNKPDFSVKVVAPQPQPDPWLNQAADRAVGMDYSRPGQLGNAWTDQFNSQMGGAMPGGLSYAGYSEGPPAYLNGYSDVYRGAIGADGKKLPRAELDLSEPRDNSPIVPTRKVGQDEHGHLSMVPYNAPNTAYRDDKDPNKIRYWDPNVRWYDRVGRGVVGLYRGPDFGNRYLNAGGRYVAGRIPGASLPYSIGGAVQGAVSRNPVRRTWDPEDPNAPAAQQQPTTREAPEPRQAALNSALTDPTPFHQTMNGGGYGGGDYSAPNYSGGGGGQQVSHPPTGGAPPVAASTSPLPTPPVGGGGGGPSPTAQPTGRQAQPRPTNPENRVNPATGDPDPNGVLPQHMPGYVPPTYISNTRDGKLQVNALYQKYYGRDSTPEEFQAHVGNPGGLPAVEAALKTDTANHIPGALGPAPGTGTGGTNTGTPQTGAGAGGGGYTYAGFDFGQDAANRDISKSAKYAFSHFAGLAGAKGIPQPRSKQEAEAWFLANIAPGMTANGFKVHKVQGDKAFISTREFPQGQWVDFQVNSGGQGDQPLAWQAENYGAGADADAEALFAVTNGGGGASGMGRGEGEGVGGVLDTQNPALNGFAQRLIQQLLEGAALDDVLERERRTTRGLTPASLAAVGF